MADYDSRLLLISEDEFRKLNFQQNPDQKQALIDDELDVLDNLEVNEEGFVTVPDKIRDKILSSDPNKFRTDPTLRYADISKGIDSKNIKVKNKKFNLNVNKVFEDEDIIRYNVVIENNDENCLVLDSIIQIAGTDFSLVDTETNVSENEKLLKSTVASNGISTDKNAITSFVKKYNPNYETLQSSIGSIPFTILTPDFLNQVDSKSIPLCPKNTTVTTGPSVSTGNGGTITPEQYTINKQGLLPYQVAVINEATKWANFCELNKDDWPVTKFVKQKDGSVQQLSDLSLVNLMKKYQKFKKGLFWCCAFQHSIIASGLENANLTNHPFYDLCSGNDSLDMGVGSSYQYAKQHGLLVPYPVPGCPAYFYKDGKPQHCILILEVRSVTGKQDAVYDCVTIEGNSTPNINVPAQYAGGGSKIMGAETGVGGKLFYRAADGGLELRYTKMSYKFMGCAVPKDVQSKANGNYDIFITGNINY